LHWTTILSERIY